MDQRYFFAVVLNGIFKSSADDFFTGPLGNYRNTFGVTVLLYPLLFADIQSLGVFTEHNQIHIVKTAFDVGQCFGRTDVAVEVEFLAQRDIHGAEAGTHGGGKRSLKCNFVLFQFLQRLVREWVADLFVGREACRATDPVDFGACFFKNSGYGFGNFRANTVSRD